MNEKNQNPETSLNDPETRMRKNGGLNWVVLLIAVLVVFAAGIAFAHCPWVMRFHAPVQDTRLNGMQAEVEALTQRVEALEKKADANSVSAAPIVAESSVQADLRSLAARVDQIQSDITQAHAAMSQNRDAAHRQIAVAMATMELRDAVDSGRGFVRELDLLQTLVKGDVSLQSDLAKLQGVAVEGVPTCAALLDKLRPLEAGAMKAEKPATAEANIWENIGRKIQDELRHFVTIRPLHHANDAVFGNLEHALAQGDAAAALAAYHNLPDEAAAFLRDWGQLLTMRRDVNEIVHDINAHAALASTGDAP